MLDERLATLFRQVAVQCPAPEGLYNYRRIHMVMVARRRDRLVAAAIACLIMLGAVSTIGRDLASAALKMIKGELKSVNMSIRLVPMTPEEEARVQARAASPANTWSFSDVDLHETKDLSTVGKDGVKRKATLRAITVAELRKERIPWQLPQYLPPYPATKAAVYERYYPGSESRITDAQAQITYHVAIKGRLYTVRYSTHWYAKPYPVPNDPRIWVSSQASIEQQVVDINGHRATAMRSGSSSYWRLTAFHTAGVLDIGSDLPLEELVKVAASIPALQ